MKCKEDIKDMKIDAAAFVSLAAPALPRNLSPFFTRCC